MNKRLTSLLIVLSCLVSSIAMADSKPEYSTIKADGHLVPVGEHHLYRYDYLPWNVSISPLFVIGHYGVGVERALTGHIAARVSGSYTDLIESSDAAEGDLRLSAPIYFRKMQDGFFFEPSIGVRIKGKQEAPDWADEYDSYYYDEGGTQAYLGSQIGWRMIWDSGLNVTAAVGMARRFESDSGDELMGLSRLDIGFAF
jgi:hypothetical protein